MRVTTADDPIKLAVPKLDYLARGSQHGMLSVSRICPVRVLWQVDCAHQGAITSLAWSSNGQFLASGGEDGMVHVWHAATGGRLCSFVHDQVVERLQWLSQGRLAASTGSLIQLFPHVGLQAAAA